MKTEQKNKSGKSKAFKAITGLLALAVLTTTVIGATMAYYTVTKTISGEAGVARNDIKIKVNDSVFSSVYQQDSGSISGLSAVIGNTETDVVAPGTTKSFEYSYEGVSEVLMHGSFDSVFELNDKWNDEDGNYYCPLVISIHTRPAIGGPEKENDVSVNGLDYQSVEEFKQAVLNQIKFADYIPSNIVWSTYKPFTLTWSWPYIGDNSKDSYLMKQAATGNTPTVTLGIAATLTQVD